MPVPHVKASNASTLAEARPGQPLIVDREHGNASRKKGSFAFGLGFTKEGTTANAKIRTPSYGP